MNTEEKLNAYIQWIMKHTSDEYSISTSDAPHFKIQFDASYAAAAVDFTKLQNTIIELSILNKKNNENVFYLHFEFNDIDHAKDLFNEMMQCFLELKNRQKKKVILCCSSALTSSFFATKLQETARTLNIDEYDFSAVSYQMLFREGFQSDVVLLAPQIGYMYDQIRSILKNTVVLKIPAAIFASYDVRGLLEFVDHHLQTPEEKNQWKYKSGQLKNNLRLLAVSVIVEYGQIRIIYRVYDHGLMVRENTILKERFYIHDLTDICDVVLNLYDIDCISISMPGVIDHGRITFKSANIWNEDISKEFTGRYGRKVYFINDANAMALGYYTLQNQYQSLCFYFHPHASRIGGVGNIMNGQLITGRNSLAGEMQYLVNALSFSKKPEELAMTPEGSLELLSGYMTAIIACNDPQAIIISCDMVPDLGLLARKLEERLMPGLVPDLVKADNIIEYTFTGCISYVLHEQSS